MVLNEFQPSPHLKEFVRVYRVIRCVFDSNSSLPFKPYAPKPEHCLSFYPRDTETVDYTQSNNKISNLSAVIFGQQSEVTHRFIGKDFLVFQIVFRPGALYRLTGIPSFELTNSFLDAEMIFSKNLIKEVNEKLFYTEDFPKMISIVEDFLKDQFSKIKIEKHKIDSICDILLSNKENISLDWFAKESCLSMRQLERKFQERMGVSPKYYNKVVRFENAFRMKNANPNLDWLSIAIQCGYYDYQHLAKDYKSFTQQTPIEFHLLDLNSPERKFGEADTY